MHRPGTSPQPRTDVVVVGGGNAGFCAALAAAERGRSVVLLEKADLQHAGGNSYYTAGATRIVHGGLPDLLDIVEPDDRHRVTEVPAYTEAEYAADLAKVTDGRNDPELTRVLVAQSQPVMRWLHGHGLRYRLMYERQAYQRHDGSYLFWGGLHIGNVDGGQGLMADHARAAAAAGVDVRYGHRVRELLVQDGAVVGVSYTTGDGATARLGASSVVLAAGGFEADPDLRERYLGPGWSKARVRGTLHNTGDLLMEALRIGAAPAGDWSTCHSVAWDAGHPCNESNRELTNRLTRQSYPLGIVVNRNGERFLDEGEDFRNYTYAKYGSQILEQPGSVAFQLFDAELRPLLRTEEYDMPGISVVVADTVEELARGAGIDEPGLRKTVAEFNAAIDTSVPFDPTVKDGRRAGVVPPKSNWAAPLRTPPFYAYPVTCGITFTFGGLRSDTHGRVLTAHGSVLPGLLVAGEMLGGLFSGNYPGGTGLAAGAVFGRRAGSIA
ncbi:FAD-dependent tricarballylate dehydrogenase TcuA [Jiangella asiatica]|uniref:FAD-dependent oxidoreductase n=1 Tax=Jiangella asiatica TaxID=2530372 RepID=A0A4R5DFC9_9ACTN|nr:FAD-dependent oxidoreductase [Jiangella asiatica]